MNKLEGCDEQHVLPQGWRVNRLKDSKVKEILFSEMESKQTGGLGGEANSAARMEIQQTGGLGEEASSATVLES